jgi:TPP-dependent pyruvate/acetoin dehydrogenase alpha subunit
LYDAELYRSKQEVEEWKRRAPITLLQNRLDEWRLCSVKDCAEIEAAEAAEIEAAVAFPIGNGKGGDQEIE